jgi:acetyl-CoA carboxylase carboxyl transferase alpha subunit
MEKPMSAATTGAPDAVQWVKCPSCDAFVYAKRLIRNLKVCPECNHHMRLKVEERLHQLLDPGVPFEDLTGDVGSVDVLAFVDAKPYPKRLEDARRKTGRSDAALYGRGTIGGHPVIVAAMDFSFMGGSMGGGVGEIITRGAELALEERTPLLLIATSGGARMQEGCISLMQMVKTSQAFALLAEAGVLTICLNTDPTYGGVTASFAMLGDVLISEPNSMIGFAGPTIIEQTIRQKLPEGFQTAEFLLEHGMLDLVEPRENIRNTIRKVLALHADGTGELPKGEGRPAVSDPDELPVRAPWATVSLAREIMRPTTLEYAGYLFEDFLELHGDRLYAENSSIVGGPALLGGLPVMLIGHQKGHTTAEMVGRNFGMPNPEGYRKALRLMHHAAKFKMPIISIVDTPGAFPGLGAEERGQGMAIARAIMEMSRLPVPIVTTVTGEGGSGGALAMAVADRVLMMENSYYSVISPEGCSTILFSDATAAPRAAAALRITGPDLLRLKVMDGVVLEPEGGAHTDPAAAAANLKTAVIDALAELLPLAPADLIAARYRRYRAFGTPGQQPVLTAAQER